MPQKKRHQTHTDRDLAGIRTRRSEPMDALPIEIDPELTPHPATPPTPEQLEQMDVGAQVRVLLENENKNAAAIAHEQNLRREAKELGALETKVADLAGHSSEWSRTSAVVEETLLPAFREIRTDMKSLLQSSEHEHMQRGEMIKAFERLLSSLGKLDERMRQLELRAEGLVRLIESLDMRDRELVLRLDKHEVMISKLDRHQAVAVALTRRDKMKVGGIATAIASAAAWAVHHFVGG